MDATGQEDRTESPPPGADSQTPPIEALAFERFPYGVLVADARGTAISVNRVLRELTAGTTVTCCTLFGCRRAGTPLEQGCLTEMALAAASPLPELRLDLETAKGLSAAWVGAARISPDNVVFQVRPGAPRDRRRRTEPHWIRGPQLRIRALGHLSVESGGASLGGQWLDQRPGELLRYLLARRGGVVHIDEISEALWNEPTAAGAGNVRYLVHTLRDRLEPNRPKRAGSSFVVTRGRGYVLDLSRIDLDVERFEAAAHRGLATTGDIGELERAIELYRGDFLADEPFADWALDEKDRLRAIAERVLRRLVEQRIGAGDIGGAIGALERLVELDPFDISAHRELLSLYLENGRRGEAHRRYAVLRRRMISSFGEQLDFSLGELTEGGDGP